MEANFLSNIGKYKYASPGNVLICAGLSLAGSTLRHGGAFSVDDKKMLMWGLASVALGFCYQGLENVRMGSVGYYPEPSKTIWNPWAALVSAITFVAFLLLSFAGMTGHMPDWVASLLGRLK